MGNKTVQKFESDPTKWDLIEAHMLSKTNHLDNKINLEYLKIMGFSNPRLKRMSNVTA